MLISTGDEILTRMNVSAVGGAISALRAFRLLRVFKLAKTWHEFQKLLTIIGNTLYDVGNFSVLLFLFIFTYTLLGMDLYAYRLAFTANDEPINYDGVFTGTYPDSNFNTFLDAIVSVFIVLANDGWSTIFFNYYRGVSSTTSTIYFLSLLIIGQYILLNLFLAILLENFDEDSLKKTVEKKQKSLYRRTINLIKLVWKDYLCCGKCKNKV